MRKIKYKRKHLGEMRTSQLITSYGVGAMVDFKDETAILAEADASLDDVVKAQLFLTDMSQFSKVSPVRNKFFAKSQPVSTMLEVNRMVKEGCMLEIEVIAMKEAK